MLLTICQLTAMLSGCHVPDETVSDAASLSKAGSPMNDGAVVPESIEENSVDNPIDHAFLHMQTILSQEELQSETYAYVYAKQWYEELVNITETIDDNGHLYFPLNSNSYINKQIEMSLAVTGEEKNASNQFFALGNFLRSETLRFKNMLMKEGKQYSYTTNEVILIERLTNYNYSLSSSSEWSEQSPLLPLASVPEKNIYLYLTAPFGQMLTIQGKSTLQLDWPNEISPQGGGLRPSMTLVDIDADMDDEIVIIHTPYTGVGITYISASEIYVVEYDILTGAVDQITGMTLDNLVNKIKPDVYLEHNNESLFLHYQEQVITIPLPEEDKQIDEYVVRIGDLVYYSIEDDSISVHVRIVIHGKDAVYPSALADLNANIKYVAENNQYAYFTIEDAIISYSER